MLKSHNLTQQEREANKYSRQKVYLWYQLQCTFNITKVLSIENCKYYWTALENGIKYSYLQCSQDRQSKQGAFNQLLHEYP